VIWVALLLAQQVLTPPASLHVACQGGHWQQVAVTGKTVSGKCVPLPPPPEPGHADVVGHADVTVEAFEAVNMTAAQALRVMSVDRSVGWNISEGLISCLPYADPPSFCCRWAWDDGSYPSPPMAWTAHPLPQWQYYTWPGQNPPTLPCPDTSSFTACFESYLATHAADWDVVSLQPDYLTAGSYQLQADDYLASYERIRAAHPNLQVILHTASLARTIGTAANAAFNDAVRAYVQTQGGCCSTWQTLKPMIPTASPGSMTGSP